MWFSVRTARTGISHFRILDFWPQIRILHTKISQKPKFFCFWYTLTTLPGGSKSTRGHNMKKCILRFFGFFFLTHTIKVPHVIYFWKALELGYTKTVIITWLKLSVGTIWQKCHFRKKTVFPDFQKIKKQPSFNFYIAR